MRTINISDKTYVDLEDILKKEQLGQIERHGRIISETPEDMIPWLVGYYKVHKELERIVTHGPDSPADITPVSNPVIGEVTNRK